LNRLSVWLVHLLVHSHLRLCFQYPIRLICSLNRSGVAGSPEQSLQRKGFSHEVGLGSPQFIPFSFMHTLPFAVYLEVQQPLTLAYSQQKSFGAIHCALRAQPQISSFFQRVQQQ